MRTAAVDKKHIAAPCRVGNLVDGLHAFTAGNVDDFCKFVCVRRNGMIAYLFLKHVQAKFTLYIIFNFINFHIIIIAVFYSFCKGDIKFFFVIVAKSKNHREKVKNYNEPHL